MNVGIIKKTFWERRKSTFFWILGLFTMSLWMTQLFESIGSNYDQILEEVPPTFEAILGEISQIGTPEGFLGIELYSIFLPIALCILTIGMGAGMIGKEEENGTLELLLASPLSRRQIFMQKVAGMKIISAAVTFSVWVAIALGTLLFPFDISLVNVLYATLSCWLLALLFGFLALTIQQFTKGRGTAIGLSAAILAISFFANTFGEIIESIEFIQYISPMHYYNGQNILVDGFSMRDFALLAAGSVYLYAISMERFANRDTGV